MIPSLSRPDHLLKQIYFYKKLKAKFTINICDSTKKPSKEFLKKINLLSKELNINYFHEPELDDREGLYFLIEKTATNYSAYCGDDDFIIPSGIIECAKYLESNKNYRVVYGNAIAVDYQSLANKNKQIIASNYWGRQTFDEEEIESRLENLSKNYHVNLFGVHRTENLLEDYKNSRNIPSRSMSEYLKNYLTIARGKGKYIDVSYLIRQIHSNRYEMPQNLTNLLVDDNFGESIPIFISTFSKALLSQNISKDESLKLSKKYIKRILLKQEKEDFKIFSEKKYFLKNIFENIYRRIFYSLKNKLFRNSNYYKDFIKFIKIIAEIKAHRI